MAGGPGRTYLIEAFAVIDDSAMSNAPLTFSALEAIDVTAANNPIIGAAFMTETVPRSQVGLDSGVGAIDLDEHIADVVAGPH